MEKIFDLQLFAGEGGSGDGGGAVGAEADGQAGSGRENGAADSNAPNSPPQKRYRAAQGNSDNTGSSCEMAGDPVAPDGASYGSTLPSVRLPRGTDRGRNEFDTGGTPDAQQEGYRAARGSDGDTGTPCELAGGPAAAIQEHFRHLEAEAEQMREVFPGFDLRRELRDPRFAALTAPGMGVSVEDAYYALHRQELQAASMQVAAQRAAQKLAFSIQSAARRPVENGAGSGTPAGLGPQAMTPKQREQLRQRIHNAAALGTKIYP